MVVMIRTKNPMTTIHQFAESLGNAIDAKDAYTGKHSMEVAETARILAFSLGLDEGRSGTIHIAGHLHDIGKIGVPDCILNKQGELSPAEKVAMQKHPQIGAAILFPVHEIAAAGICEMVLYHHERFDGQGYPQGLAGEAIPLGARIIAVADSLSAMTGPRSYRPPKSFHAAVNEIVARGGSQFDPRVVTALIDSKDIIHRILCQLNGGQYMSKNFQIEIKSSNDKLHVTPHGDFDGSSAWELVNLLDKHYHGNEKVIIDTRFLVKIDPFGCDVLRHQLNARVVPPDHLVFRGENAGLIAVEGSCVETPPLEGHSCRCDGTCRQYKCRGETEPVKTRAVS